MTIDSTRSTQPKMQPEPKVEMGFVQRRLPWLVAGAALLVYALTLNYSASFAGIAALAKAAGWDWRANVVAPLHVLLTFPIRWLPAALQLPALNLTAAVCAAGALGFLARSVALLPHDRTREQRGVERSDYSMLSIRSAWLPPILAALVCGLQLTFWENAVVATGEALDLLIFAWLIHCLLQYRLDEKESRLTWFAFVYGLSVTNNFAMIAFAPAFLVALVWIKGLSFFNWRFLLRTTAVGIAGLLLYLLLPAIGSASNSSGFTFWELLKSYWGYQKNNLLALPRYIFFLTSFTSILPILFMGIRWPAQFGETSAVGNLVTNLMTHVIHAVFLVACIYVAFDPPFSPRNLSGELFNLLPLYYLGALAIGYFSGYFLLVFGAPAGPRSWERPSPLRKAINFALVALIWVAVIAVPIALARENLPVIRANTGKAMSRLSQAAAKSLPPAGAFVFSDDVFQLYALKNELMKADPNHKHVLVDTTSLGAAGYHRTLQKDHPDRWPKFVTPPQPKASIDSVNLIEMLYQLSKTGPVYYLHPSFGYYFEYFYMRPHQMIKDQDAYWESLRAREIDPLIKKAVPFTKMRPGKDKPRPRTVDVYLAETYSRALNHFGVEAQKAGHLETAGKYFDLALQCNPANPAAHANRDFNRLLSAGKPANEKISEEVTERLKPYGGQWDAILGQNGPVDEPGACYVLARAFEQGNNFRQAAQNLERTIHFAPDNRNAQLISMLVCVKANLPDRALEKISQFRSRYAAASLTEEEEMELLRAEAWAHLMKNELATSEKLLAGARTKYPKQSTPWETLVDIYLQLGRITNAIATLDEQLKSQPDSTRALVNYGALKIRLGKFAEALPYLDRALQLNPKDEASLWNRAMASQALERLDAALQDFTALHNSGTTTYRVQVLYGLAETYYRKKNRQESLRYYKDFLKAAPAGMPEIVAVKERVKLLESGASL
jgi:tetratricopeptide (TPR) repeat protein